MNFSNFITEGLDIWIPDHKGDLWTKDILSAANHLIHILNAEFHVMSGDITPDDNNYDQRRGNINVYQAKDPEGTPIHDDEDHKNTAFAAMQWLKKNGFKIEMIERDVSGFHAGDPVWRIKIDRFPPNNNSPDLHFTYSRASTVFKFLGYPAISTDSGFDIDPWEMIARINKYENNLNRMKQHETPNEREGNVYSMGTDYTDIQIRIAGLKRLAEWAIINGYKRLRAN